MAGAIVLLNFYYYLKFPWFVLSLCVCVFIWFNILLFLISYVLRPWAACKQIMNWKTKNWITSFPGNCGISRSTGGGGGGGGGGGDAGSSSISINSRLQEEQVNLVS
jgi:uncharacterized membrane protein YgcG